MQPSQSTENAAASASGPLRVDGDPNNSVSSESVSVQGQLACAVCKNIRHKIPLQPWEGLKSRRFEGADRPPDAEDLLTALQNQEDVDKVVDLLDRGAPIDKALPAFGSKAPLHLACASQNVDAICALLACGAQLDVPDGNGLTPLHYVAATGSHEVVECLLSRGASPNMRDMYGCTPLFWAGCNGNVEVAGQLLQFGADLTSNCNGRSTPLMCAVDHGQLEVVRLLIRNGCKLQHRANGMNPIGLAIHTDQVDMVHLLLSSLLDMFSAQTVL